MKKLLPRGNCYFTLQIKISRGIFRDKQNLSCVNGSLVSVYFSEWTGLDLDSKILEYPQNKSVLCIFILQTPPPLPTSF